MQKQRTFVLQRIPACWGHHLQHMAGTPRIARISANWCITKMASVKRHNAEKKQQMHRKLLEELNEKRESHCLVERSNQVSLLRVQRRHFSQAHQSSAWTHIKVPVPESGRDSWVNQRFLVFKEKRHFPLKSA
ncbi:spermatogenesis-associated protein 45 isoform X2 [Psammomys obesus]|uniref:spermatogenesis-associated protein 45 isoform X2 n=1 Tax=Psammomys obesus TaxID=48139 RepID=UPI0024531B6A|nr:spermatogenesis-associated protein 45 isoform X2 [Psammomys obesus]